MDKNNNSKTMLLNINMNTLPLDKQIDLGSMKLIKVDAAFDLYPEIKVDFKWTRDDLIEFYNSKLLIGILEEGELSITDESLESLINYRKGVLSKEN